MAIVIVERGGVVIGALTVEPFGEVRCRRQRHKRADARDLAGNFLDHLLDQKMTEGHATQAALTIGDRIEHGGSGPPRLDRIAFVREDRRDGGWNGAGERHFDEDQRLVNERRMKKRVAAAIWRIDTPAQIGPVPDLMDRLITDDLFQDRR